jgi:hypothetical protein
MNGVFHEGPTMEPFSQMYMPEPASQYTITDCEVSDGRLTLIISHQRQEDGEECCPHVEVLVKAR